MYRMAMAQLQAWKMKKRRKPIIIRGARQVGKTWLMREFGASEYASTVYINFDNNERMKALFEGGLEVERLVTGLELLPAIKSTRKTPSSFLTKCGRLPRFCPA